MYAKISANIKTAAKLGGGDYTPGIRIFYYSFKTGWEAAVTLPALLLVGFYVEVLCWARKGNKADGGRSGAQVLRRVDEGTGII